MARTSILIPVRTCCDRKQGEANAASVTKRDNRNIREAVGADDRRIFFDTPSRKRDPPPRGRVAVYA